MESPSHIAKEVKALQQQLKEALGKDGKDPYDREVEFRRQSLRRLYLRLILSHPYAKESKDVDTHLWMQTSYQFIATFKQRISALERAGAYAQRHHGRHQQTGNSGPGPVEIRKLISRFRQFLAEEEKFWTQLLVRFARSFALDEVKPALVAVSILPPDGSSPEEAPTTPSKGNSVARNHFPEEGDPVSPSDEQRPGRLAIASKMLVCLGDIARYREQYNESGGRPRAGHEDGAPRRGVRDTARPRNYERAQQYYEQARLLVPDEGNASHQLAILASYQKDIFGSLFHYYRALCVRQPYETAAENLNNVLSKALESFKNKQASGKAESNLTAPRARIDAFKSRLVLLHALWRVDADEMDRISPDHAGQLLDTFSALVADRALSIEMIMKVIALALGALWKHRTIRDVSNSAGKTAARRNAAEARIAAHAMDLFRILLLNGARELSEYAEETAPAGLRDDLSQQITATFRRTLPALRVCSKWCRANFTYLNGATVPAPFPDSAKALWTAYMDFWTTLHARFPRDELPTLSGPLDEDIEMNGFSPLKRHMREPSRSSKNGLTPGQNQVHPNEEQLMRIADLLDDAQLLADMKDSPIASAVHGVSMQSGQATQGTLEPLIESFVAPPDPPNTERLALVPDLPISMKEIEDDNMTVASVTTDDPVGDAFRTALEIPPEDDDEDLDEDEIVWNPRASSDPPMAPISPPQPQLRTPPALTPIRPPYSPTRSSNTNLGDSATTPTKGATAQDLLASIMGPRSPGDFMRHNRHLSASTTPQAPLLFGQGTTTAPTHSIWSTAGLESSSYALSGPSSQGIAKQQPFAAHAPAPFSQGTQSTQTSIWSTTTPSQQPSDFLDASSSNGLPIHRVEPQHQPRPSMYQMNQPPIPPIPSAAAVNNSNIRGFSPALPTTQRSPFSHTRGYSYSGMNGSGVNEIPMRTHGMQFSSASTWAPP